jgi:DNA primase
VAWNELDQNQLGEGFNVGNIRERLSRPTADPWATFFKIEQTLPAEPAPKRRQPKKTNINANRRRSRAKLAVEAERSHEGSPSPTNYAFKRRHT